MTDGGHLVLRLNGIVEADIPVDPLVSESPEYDRPWEASEVRPTLAPDEVQAADPADALTRLMASPPLASRRWIWEQYDHLINGRTVRRPGGDAAVVAVDRGDRALAITTDCAPRYCVADPVEGGKQAVAEAWRNLTAVGATPLAVTNNLNFGNPERPAIMGQLVGCVQGMGEACRALDFPVISGNVSLYNETGGVPILPTPAIGGVGLIDNIEHMATLAFKSEGETILLLGHKDEAEGWLGQSLYLREICGQETGAPPPVDLAHERSVGDFVRELIGAGRITACHDLSDGGLLVALTEMALAGNIGCTLSDIEGPQHSRLFGEDQGRYVVTVKTGDVATLQKDAEKWGAPIQIIGTTGGTTITFGGGKAELSTLRALNEGWFPSYMAGKA